MDLNSFVERGLSVPFRDHGRDWDGWDCWGLIYVAYRDVVGSPVPAYDSGYASSESLDELDALISQYMDGWVKVQSFQPADVALFRVSNRLVHVGLMIGPKRMIHAEEKVGTIVDPISNPMWAKRMEGVYRRAG